MSRDCKPKGPTWNAHFHAFHLQTLHTFAERLLNQDANAALQVRWQQNKEDSFSAAHVRGRGSDKPRAFGNAVIMFLGMSVEKGATSSHRSGGFPDFKATL